MNSFFLHSLYTWLHIYVSLIFNYNTHTHMYSLESRHLLPSVYAVSQNEIIFKRIVGRYCNRPKYSTFSIRTYLNRWPIFRVIFVTTSKREICLRENICWHDHNRIPKVVFLNTLSPSTLIVIFTFVCFLFIHFM